MFIINLETIFMEKASKREKLEELRDLNRKIQDEILYWSQRVDELEKEISKHYDSFSSMKAELDRSILQLLQFGGKFTQSDNWKDERFI